MDRRWQSMETKSPQHAVTGPFDFMGLPLELRLMCYNHVLSGLSKGSPAIVNIHQLIMSRSQPVVPRKRSAQVLRTCRTIYDEALPILYSTHVFHSSHFKSLAKALRSLGARAQQHIKHIIIHHPGDPEVPGPSILRREMRALGVLPKPENLPTLPPLPGLRTVKIYILLRITDQIKTGPTVGEDFMSDMIQSKPEHGHFLRDYLHAMRHSPGPEVTVQLLQQKGYYVMMPSIGSGRRRVHRQWHAEEDLRMDLGLQYHVQEGKMRNREHWTFVGDVNDGQELAVKVRCHKDNNQMDERYQIRTLRI